MADQNVAAELDALQNMFETTEAFEGVDDANYIGKIEEIRIQKSGSGNISAMTKYVIADEGKFFEKPVNGFHTLNNEEGLAYFKGFCAAIGLQLPQRFADLQAACNDFVAENNSLFKITVKTSKGGFKNVYVNGVHEPEA